MKKHHPLAIGAIALMSLALAACGSGTPAGTATTSSEPAAPASSSSAAGGGTFKIGFSVSTMANPYFVAMQEGVTKAMKDTGAQVTSADAGNDASKQADDVLNFISQKMDAVLLNPTDGDAIVPSVEALNKAGIPVFTVDRTSNGGTIVSYMGTDNVAAGETAAKALFEALGGKGNVAILEGIPGASSAIDRGTGFKNMEANYPDIKIVASQTANFDRTQGMTVAQNIIQANPDLSAFLCMNDEMALGAIEAINAAGLTGKIKVNGIDGGADAVNAVKAGTMTFTVAQQPALMGEQSIKNIVTYLQGGKVDANIPVATITIDSTNVDQFIK